MSQQIVRSSALYLKSKAIESYTIIKDLLEQPPEEGIAEKVAAEALRLAQLENAMITVQQYFGNASTPVEEVPPPPPSEPEQKVQKVTPEISPAYKRALEKQKTKKSS
tara:strand:+ start:542 stop:865 length:324 start_codon:yes stop_codon:yes gene_type:complete